MDSLPCLHRVECCRIGKLRIELVIGVEREATAIIAIVIDPDAISASLAGAATLDTAVRPDIDRQRAAATNGKCCPQLRTLTSSHGRATAQHPVNRAIRADFDRVESVFPGMFG